MLPIKFQVNWILFQEIKRKIDFQDGGHSGHPGFPIGRFKLFLIYHSLRCILSRFESVGLSLQEKTRKMFFKKAAIEAILDFKSE